MKILVAKNVSFEILGALRLVLVADWNTASETIEEYCLINRNNLLFLAPLPRYAESTEKVVLFGGLEELHGFPLFISLDQR